MIQITLRNTVADYVDIFHSYTFVYNVQGAVESCAVLATSLALNNNEEATVNAYASTGVKLVSVTVGPEMAHRQRRIDQR